MPVTGDKWWSGLSDKLSDVWMTPRIVAWLALKREMGIHAEGAGENSSSRSGVLKKKQGLLCGR